jgi:hypothetical protein
MNTADAAPYKGTVFMYPCAYKDIPIPFGAFASEVDTLLFVDINYNFNQFEPPCVAGWTLLPGSISVEGARASRCTRVNEGNSRYRSLAPGWLRASYQRDASPDKTVELVLRRGFGQYALRELKDGQLKCFLHRGDSSGESGSGACFFANKKMRHPPLSNLFDYIKKKLTPTALLGSDGSNTAIPELLRASQGERICEFRAMGLKWVWKYDLGALPYRGQTVIWEVTNAH